MALSDRSLHGDLHGGAAGDPCASPRTVDSLPPPDRLDDAAGNKGHARLVPPSTGASQAPSSPAPSPKITWAQLLLRVFGEDVLRCPACGGCRHMISSITDPSTIRRILDHFGLRTEPYALDPARPPPQAALDW